MYFKEEPLYETNYRWLRVIFYSIEHKDTLRSPSLGDMASVYLVWVNRVLRLPAECRLERDHRILERAKVGEILRDIHCTVSMHMAGRTCGVCFNLDGFGPPLEMDHHHGGTSSWPNEGDPPL